MINIKHKTCEEPGCNIRPSFNLPNQTIGKYCSKHKKVGMIDIKNKTCEEHGCNKQPVFNLPNQTVAKYCYAHKKDGMINVKDKTCEEPGCNTLPTFNIPEQTVAKYCATHKKVGMIDIKNKTCEEPGCDTRPNFNIPGQTIAKYCATHKKVGMINVKHKTCEEQGCNKQPYFNLPGKTVAKYCATHKKDEMVNVISKSCEEPGCNKHPYFNLPGKTLPRFCDVHKKDGMINIKTKRCEEKECNTLANYGFCGQKVTRCVKHKLNGMFFKPKRNCSNDNCNNIAIFGISEPIHCEDHKTSEEFNLCVQKCKGNNCPYPNEMQLLNKKELCQYCDENDRFQELKKHEKKKEMLVLNYLNEHINSNKIIKIVDDKIIDSFCNKKRPDRIYDCGTHYAIVEIDENQHSTYDNTNSNCELRRMHEIQNSAGLHCIFLRFNPDNFRIKGILQKVNMNQRLKMLVKWINHCIEEMKPDKDLMPVKYKHLYYDEYDDKDVSFIEIDDYELEKC